MFNARRVCPHAIPLSAIILTVVLPLGCAASETGSVGRGDVDGGAARNGVDAGGFPDRPIPPGPSGSDACDRVDLLFVIDNSPSMGPYQEALAAAFPGFVDAMYESLPSGTSLHVGITTTSFYTGSCSETVVNCRSAETPADIASRYVPPTMGDTGTPGEQGRLFPTDGITYFDANTGDPDRTPLKDWFSRAATAAGEDGCSFEMPTAAASYALHEANGATNAGFLRDDDTVLVLFVLSDEPDKSPEALAGYLETIAAAKSECGGLECVVPAGLVESCLQRVDNTLWQFLNAFPTAPTIGDIDSPERYVEVVGDALVRVVEQRCNEIILI